MKDSEKTQKAIEKTKESLDTIESKISVLEAERAIMLDVLKSQEHQKELFTKLEEGK